MNQCMRWSFVAVMRSEYWVVEMKGMTSGEKMKKGVVGHSQKTERSCMYRQPASGYLNIQMVWHSAAVWMKVLPGDAVLSGWMAPLCVSMSANPCVDW